MNKPLLLALCLGTTISFGALAQPPQGGGGGGRRGPPPEATAACSGQAEGASCSFQGPPGAISGTCRRVPEGVMACVPSGPPPGGHRGAQ